MKSTVEQIRERFDRDVERFSNLETGQAAAIDATLLLELIAQSAARVNPAASDVLDVGCGAGNFALKILGLLPNLNSTLVDLSANMLARAQERVRAATTGAVTTVQSDIRDARFSPGQFDIIVAASVLHHLRTDAEWRHAFEMFHTWLKPGGSIWISDLVCHTLPAIQQFMWARYGDHLVAQRDAAYRDLVHSYVENEDTPRPVFFQCDLLRSVGFREVEILHKNSVFAAFGAIK